MITDKLYYSIKKGIRNGYPNLSEDQVAEALHFGIMEAEKRYDPQKGESFGPWVWLIVKYRLIDELRRTGLHNRYGKERTQRYINTDENCYEFAVDFDPLENMIAEETMEKILRQFTNKKFEQIIRLTIKGFNRVEIAKKMRMSVGTIYRYFNTIRETILGQDMFTLRYYSDPANGIRSAERRRRSIKETLQKRWTHQREMNRA